MFAGLISKEQSVSEWGEPDKILAALAPYSLDKPRDIWATDKQMLLQVATRNDATTAEIYRHPESGLAVAFWGRLDNRPNLIHQLEAQNKASDDELIALAWLKWGEFCPEKLIGDFAFAVASPKTGVVFLARDVMGVKPLFYRNDVHGVFFASTAAAFKPLKLGSLTPCKQWMAKYLVDLSHSHTETAFEEVKKLPGAHCLLIQTDGCLKVRRYHQFINDAPSEGKRDPKYLEAYRALWQESVACRMPTTGNIGTESSGGLDSGSITAEIARVLGPNIERLHGMGFCTEALEPEYIMATAMQYSMKNNLLFSHDMSDSWSEIRRREHLVQGYPSDHNDGSAHNPFHWYCAQNNISVLFSGFGGDEGVTNPGVMLCRLELFDQRNWLGLWQILPAVLPLKIARFLKMFWLSRNMPKYHKGFVAAWRKRWAYQFISNEAITKFDLENAFFASATYDERFRSINDAAIYLLARPYAPARLENCTLMAASYGVDYIWPLFDQRLIQQWLSTPVIWKVGEGSVSRYLHRCAVNKVCPDLVAWKLFKDMNVTDNSSLPSDFNDKKYAKKLAGLIQSMPADLECFIDIPKARKLIAEVVSQKEVAGSVYSDFREFVRKFEDLSIWLKSL